MTRDEKLREIQEGFTAMLNHWDILPTLLTALAEFSDANPKFVPAVGDVVCWSRDGMTPQQQLFSVTGIARSGADTWNAHIESLGPSEAPTERHIVPSVHLARVTDVFARCDRLLEVRRQEQSLLAPPRKPTPIH